jgi:peptidoglycan/LPS O-acetylase OafA/YrhL
MANLFDMGDLYRQLANWFYVSNFFIERHGWYTLLGHLWSLAVEEQFYIAFAPLVLALPRRYLPHLCIGLMFVSVCAHLLLWATGSPLISFDVNSFVNFGLLAVGGLAGLFADRSLPRWLAGDPAIVVTFFLFLLVPTLAVWLLELWPVREIGLISYGAYLFHPVVKAEGILDWFGYFGPLSYKASVAFEFVVTLLLAELSWHVLENPIRNLARRRTTAP